MDTFVVFGCGFGSMYVTNDTPAYWDTMERSVYRHVGTGRVEEDLPSAKCMSIIWLPWVDCPDMTQSDLAGKGSMLVCVCAQIQYVSHYSLPNWSGGKYQPTYRNSQHSLTHSLTAWATI